MKSRRSAAFGAVLTALVAFLALGARLGHMALVAHQVCPEHGELLHVEHDNVSSEVEHAKDVQVSRAADRKDDRHDHCDALAHSATVSSPPVVPEPILIALPLSAVLHDRAAITRDRIWLLAPKNSPPV